MDFIQPRSAYSYSHYKAVNAVDISHFPQAAAISHLNGIPIRMTGVTSNTESHITFTETECGFPLKGKVLL